MYLMLNIRFFILLTLSYITYTRAILFKRDKWLFKIIWINLNKQLHCGTEMLYFQQSYYSKFFILVIHTNIGIHYYYIMQCFAVTHTNDDITEVMVVFMFMIFTSSCFLNRDVMNVFHDLEPLQNHVSAIVFDGQ